MTAFRQRRRPIVAAAALAAVFAAAWFALDLVEDRPGWVAVEGPRAAVAGRPIEFRVTLSRSIGPGLMVDCTLHHADAERKGWGYLASAGPARPAVGGAPRSFVFRFPARPDTAYVFAVVYLSPTGRWPEATEAASTAYVPVAPADRAEAGAGLRKMRLLRFPTAAESGKASTGAARPIGRPSVWVHPILGILFLAAAFLAGKAGLRPEVPGPPADGGQRVVWLAFAVLLFACAAVEVSGIAGHLASWGRQWAQAQGVYELRRPLQKALTAAAAAGSLGFFILFIRAMRKPGPRRFLWWAGIGLAEYLAVSFVGALSLHAADAVLGLVWHGLSAYDGARGAGAVVIVASAWLAGRRKTGPAPT